jgi:hypothetical protein
VQIRGAHVDGSLDLTHLALRYPRELRDCYVDSGVDLTTATGPDLGLAGGHLNGTLQARGTLDPDTGERDNR